MGILNIPLTCSFCKDRSKFAPLHAMKAYVGGGIYHQSFLTSTPNGDEWSASRLGRITPEERERCARCTGSLAGPRPLMDILNDINVFYSFRKSDHDYRVVRPAAFYLRQLHLSVSVYVLVVYVVALPVAETV